MQRTRSKNLNFDKYDKFDFSDILQANLNLKYRSQEIRISIYQGRLKMNKYYKQFKNLSLEKKRIAIISGLVILSFFSLLFANQLVLKKTLGNTVFQFIGSWLLSFVFTQFYNKYYNSSSFTWWVRLYLFMIIGTIFWAILLKIETIGI